MGDVNTPLSPRDRSARKKLNREIRELTDTYRTFLSNTKEFTFFSVLHGISSKIDHILGNKANLNRYKKIRITACILPNHHGLKLEFNNNAIAESLQIYEI